MSLAVPLAGRVARLAAQAAPVEDPATDIVVAFAREASRAALDRGETHYTDRPGIVPLRLAVATMLERRFGVDVGGHAGVVITCGVTEARFVAIQQLLPAGGGTVVALAHPERVAGACVVRDVRLVGPSASPQGPTVVYIPDDFDATQREAWVERARSSGWALVAEVGSDTTTHPAADGLGSSTVTIGDLLEPHGAAAWRVGFMAAPPATVGPLRDFKQALTLCTTNLSQWGALAILEERP
jgi:hypothetical protein